LAARNCRGEERDRIVFGTIDLLHKYFLEFGSSTSEPQKQSFCTPLSYFFDFCKRSNPKNGKIAPLPDWGAKDLKLGALRAVIRQLELDWREFLKAK
jgi:hypothetical protein